eukprot:5886270-Prymnesium_polylepis.2
MHVVHKFIRPVTTLLWHTRSFCARSRLGALLTPIVRPTTAAVRSVAGDAATARALALAFLLRNGLRSCLGALLFRSVRRRAGVEPLDVGRRQWLPERQRRRLAAGQLTVADFKLVGRMGLFTWRLR